MYFFAALKTKPSEQDIARSLCARIKALTRDSPAERFCATIACRLGTLHPVGGCQQRVQFVNQKSCNTQLARTTSNTERRQWAAEVTSSASPAARTACSVRGAASRPTLSMTPGLRAVAATLASESRRWQTRSMGRGALADASPRPTTQTRRHGHGRPQQMLQLPLPRLEEHAPAGH